MYIASLTAWRQRDMMSPSFRVLRIRERSTAVTDRGRFSRPAKSNVTPCKTPGFGFPSPLRRKGLGIWRTIERSIAVDREIASLERSQGPFDVVEMPNWGSESLVYSFHPRAPLVVRLSTPLAQVNHLRGNLPPRPGMRLLCYLEALCARRAACLIATASSSLRPVPSSIASRRQGVPWCRSASLSRSPDRLYELQKMKELPFSMSAVLRDEKG